MKQRLSVLAVLGLLTLTLIAVPAVAQEFRGAIRGIVKDSSGAVLPGVTVTVTNVETNVASTAVTDAKGAYQVPYLNAGTYDVEANLEGFKSVRHTGLKVRIGDSLPVDFKLDLGGMQEVIFVVAQTPLLDTTSGSTGQVIESSQIEQLPLGDGTAYMLTRLTPGVADSSDLHFSRPADNGNLAGITVNGALGGNEFTLDGAPNRVSPNNPVPGNNSGVVGFSPPSDAISEFKVQTNSFDAQSGHTAGATVNLALKSGTNSLKGALSYFDRNGSRTAMPLLTERAGGDKPVREYSRYTGMVAGPLRRDQSFFMLSFERLHDVQAEPASYTVPTLLARKGDLSEYGVTVYDPLTASGSTNTRKAFAGAIIPDQRIDPVARAYANLYPEPNRPGTDGNFFTNQVRPYDYNALLGRFDHNFNGNNRAFLTGYWNKRRENRYNWAGIVNNIPVTEGFDYRGNRGATLGYTWTGSSSLLLDVRGAWSRFDEYRAAAAEIDPATLGFSPQAIALMNGYKYLPFITFGGFSTTNANSRIASLGSQRADFGTGFNRPFTDISFAPTATWLYNAHSIRGGYDMRLERWRIEVPAYGAGRYNFNGAYTRLNNSAPLNDPAQEWAQFLLGLPTTGTGTVANAGSTSSQFEIAATADYRQNQHALFAQDDWRITPRLTANIGLRYELNQAMREADNRNLGGFDPAIQSPIAAAALANYAKNPIPEIAPADFQVRGGVRFADGGIYNNLHRLLPRGAFSYLIGDRTVLRGGVGLFSYDYYFDAGNQTGFSQPTGIITTENNGTTFLGPTLSNPIPSGTLIQPSGSSLGAATGLGLNIGTVVPSVRKNPYYTRWQLGAQHEFGTGWVVETYYVDSAGKHLPVTREINGVPMQYLSTSATRDTANETFLSASVANPFAGMLPGTGLNGSTIARSQLLRPFPQFLSVVTEEYVGSDHYRAGSLRLEKRFAGGNSVIASYTRSHETDKLNFLNPASDVLESRISPNDRPNRITLGATVALPFGQGRMFGNNWHGVTEAILGGWSISGTYQYQTGAPLVWNNNIYYDPNRDPNDLHAHIGGNCPNGGIAGLDCAAWDTSGFYIPGGTGRTDTRIQLGNNVRYFPSTLAHVRTDDLRLLDLGLYKTFALVGGTSLQIRIEALNATNYTVLWNPTVDPRNANFGLVNQDRNNPRDIQLGARITF